MNTIHKEVGYAWNGIGIRCDRGNGVETKVLTSFAACVRVSIVQEMVGLLGRRPGKFDFLARTFF